MTKYHGLGLEPIPGVLELFDPNDVAALNEACARILLSPPDPDDVRALVKDYSWSTVARDIIEIYNRLLAGNSE